MARERKVERSSVGVYVRRARELARSMERAHSDGMDLAAAVLAVQCAIASSDAVCASKLGRVASPQRHQDAAALLAACTVDGAKERAEQLRRILELKSAAEYDDRTLSAREVATLVERTRRLHQWAMDASMP